MKSEGGKGKGTIQQGTYNLTVSTPQVEQYMELGIQSEIIPSEKCILATKTASGNNMKLPCYQPCQHNESASWLAFQLTPKPRKKMPNPMALSLLQGGRARARWEEEEI